MGGVREGEFLEGFTMKETASRLLTSLRVKLKKGI